MKRIIVAIAIIFAILFIYNGWVNVDTPQTIDDLEGDLAHQVLAYEVIEGKPLIVAVFGGSVFLDTLHLKHISKAMPPYPTWQWTGNWERVSHPESTASADLTSFFGPTVLYGLINNEDVVELRVMRDGEVIRTVSVDGSAYIIEASDVKLTDTLEFVDANGEMVTKTPLMGTGD